MSEKEWEKGLNPITGNKSTGGFSVVMKWTGVFFLLLIAIGYFYRLLMPIELHLDENEYIKRVFVEHETEAYTDPAAEGELIGLFEEGTVFYVIDQEDVYYQVRPFSVALVDSVWISKENTISYSPENYRRWQNEQDRRQFDMD